MYTSPTATTIEHVTLIDGTGGAPRPDSSVLIQGGRVQRVGAGPEVQIPAGSTIIDGRGKWLIPGLVDTHAHADVAGGVPAMRNWLACGVTTLRDTGGRPEAVLRWRDEERRGQLVSPRIVSHGPWLDGHYPIIAYNSPSMNGLHNAYRVLTVPEAVDFAVDECLAMGVDGFKLYAGMRPDFTARAVKRVADRVPIAAHVGRTWGSEAAEAGVTSLEHVIASCFQDVARPEDRHGREDGNGDDPHYWTWRLVQGWANADLDADYVHRFIELLIRKNTYISATVVLSLVMMDLAPFHADGTFQREGEVDPDLSLAPWSTAKRWDDRDALGQHLVREGSLIVPERKDPDLAVRQRALEKMLQFVGMFHASGGKLLTGTDSGVRNVVPGQSLHTELELFSAAGIDPVSILRASSYNAAEAMRLADEQGTLTTGKRADAVLLTADPIADIRNTRKIEVVIKGGNPYFPGELVAKD